MHHFCSSYPVFFTLLCLLIAATATAGAMALVVGFAGSRHMRTDYSRVREWNALARIIRRAWLPLGIGISITAAACMFLAHDRIIGISVFVVFGLVGLTLVWVGKKVTPLERYEKYG